MDALLMQSAGVCEPGMSGIDYVREFEFFSSIACTYASVVGMLVLGLFVYGAVSLSIFVRTGSVTIPVVLLLLTGGAVVPYVASPGVAVITVALLTAGGGAFALLYYRYSR